jgi:hypothetical protein
MCGVDVRSVRFMTARHHDGKGSEYEKHFDPLGGRNA